MKKYNIGDLHNSISEKIAISATGCWEWTAYRDRGYGRKMWKGKVVLAHRLVWESLVGPIPHRLMLDHVCRNRACCNPSHLRSVSPRENALINNEGPTAVNAAKLQCTYGHPFTGANLRPYKLGDNLVWRVCRKCVQIRKKRYKK